MVADTIYNEDCLGGMARLETGSIDMILCDLPFGTTRNAWDNIIPLDKLWEQYERIIKPHGAIVLFAQTPFDKVLGASNLKMLKYEWIWSKNIATGHLNAEKMPLKKHENILVFYKRPPTYNPQKTFGHSPYKPRGGGNEQGRNYGDFGETRKGNIDGSRFPVSVLSFGCERGLHPTQKPVALCEYLIRTYTNAGELVLDSCAGSGTTAVACRNTGRHFICFETSIQYCAIANERLTGSLHPQSE